MTDPLIDPKANPSCHDGHEKLRRGPTIVAERDGPKDCNACFSTVLDQFAKSFDKSAKRWELIVYPSLFAFIVLAMYGFFLIYYLTQDIRLMASSIDPKMGPNMTILTTNLSDLAANIEIMSTHLEYISDNMETMSVDMQTMSENIEGMTENVSTMNKSVGTMSTQLNTLPAIVANMTAMNQGIYMMAGSMGRMGYDVNGMSRPMSFINKFMPW